MFIRKTRLTAWGSSMIRQWWSTYKKKQKEKEEREALRIEAEIKAEEEAEKQWMEESNKEMTDKPCVFRDDGAGVLKNCFVDCIHFKKAVAFSYMCMFDDIWHVKKPARCKLWKEE